ncbi:MAG: replication initiation factor [Polaromonas sp.]|nr:replication initiation factor [Polaromonas sp.]
MTKPSKGSLVLDGSEVKYRLEAERLASKTPVHVDWVRFTVLRRNAPHIMVEPLVPCPYLSDRQEPQYKAWADQTRVDWTARFERNEWARLLAGVDDADYAAVTQALELAEVVCKALGDKFTVNQEVKKGHDFYRCRWSLERLGVECGWVGFLASGESPRQRAQSQTIHCNLYGMACTFADSGWRDRIADIVEEREATLTRCDLALDFFNGLHGGIHRVRDEYNAGLCNVAGKLLKVNFAGDWSEHSKGARSIYFGSREAGKETNVYEKGDQLFGVGVSPWLRAELRYGNKLRVLPVDMLRRPADFFAGASDWHAELLRLADFTPEPERVKCIGRLPIETVKAECVRSLRWLQNTAAPTMAAAFSFLDTEQLASFIESAKLPGRLAKFARSELASVYSSAFGLMPSPAGSPPLRLA